MRGNATERAIFIAVSVLVHVFADRSVFHAQDTAASALTGNDKPGSVLTLTARRNGNLFTVKLVRGDVSILADKRVLFELFASIKKRALQYGDADLQECVDAALEQYDGLVEDVTNKYDSLLLQIHNMQVREHVTHLVAPSEHLVAPSEQDRTRRCVSSRKSAGPRQ